MNGKYVGSSSGKKIKRYGVSIGDVMSKTRTHRGIMDGGGYDGDVRSVVFLDKGLDEDEV